MFSSNQPAFPIVALAAYVVSFPWLVPAQLFVLRRWSGGASTFSRVGMVLAGEGLAIGPGALAVAACMEFVRVLATSLGASATTLDVLLVSDLSRPLAVLPVLLAWLAAWTAVAAALKSLVLRFAVRRDTLARSPWHVAWRMSARGYAGTAVATIAIVVATWLGLG